MMMFRTTLHWADDGDDENDDDDDDNETTHWADGGKRGRKC